MASPKDGKDMYIRLDPHWKTLAMTLAEMSGKSMNQVVADLVKMWCLAEIESKTGVIPSKVEDAVVALVDHRRHLREEAEREENTRFESVFNLIEQRRHDEIVEMERARAKDVIDAKRQALLTETHTIEQRFAVLLAESVKIESIQLTFDFYTKILKTPDALGNRRYAEAKDYIIPAIDSMISEYVKSPEIRSDLSYLAEQYAAIADIEDLYNNSLLMITSGEV